MKSSLFVLLQTVEGRLKFCEPSPVGEGAELAEADEVVKANPFVNLRLPPSSRRKAIICKALGFNWVLTCFKIYSSTAIAVPLPSQGKANVIVTFGS